MSELITINAAEALDGYRLRITFSDGAIKEVDLRNLIGEARGVFRKLAELGTFKQARVNPETRTIEWPGGVDLDPEVLYGLFEPASGVRITRRTLRGSAAVSR
jgi:hypothetical protein